MGVVKQIPRITLLETCPKFRNEDKEIKVQHTAHTHTHTKIYIYIYIRWIYQRELPKSADAFGRELFLAPPTNRTRTQGKGKEDGLGNERCEKQAYKYNRQLIETTM